LCCGHGYELNDAFPHTLVTALFLSLYKDFENMRFFAPTLPLSYYKQEMPAERASFLAEHKLDRILSAAKSAHIIITGIGTTSSPGFQHAYKVAEEETSYVTQQAQDNPGIPRDLPEICYQPMDDTGDLFPGKYRVVGVTLEELRAAAGHPSDPISPDISETSSQHVIAIAGGAAKASVIAKALRHRRLPFNTLITDTDVTKVLFAGPSATP
jgi:DNA-binding transcriptional regulator LsrR (DeoR family)